MMGRTVWDRVRGTNKPVPNENKVWNPLDIKLNGDFVHIDILDYREWLYRIKSVSQLDRGTNHPLADYSLEADLPIKLCNDERRSVILRCAGRGDASDKLPFQVLLMKTFFSCGWDEDSRPGIMDGVNDPSGEFVIDGGTPEERRYWRMHGLKAAETVAITTAAGSEGDMLHSKIEQWNYSRSTKDESGFLVDEYLSVSKCLDTGFITILVGREVPPERIVI